MDVHIFFDSVVGCVRTVGQGRRAPAHHHDGTHITRCVIHAISRGTKASPVRYANGRIGRPPTGKWSNAICAISKYISLFHSNKLIVY